MRDPEQKQSDLRSTADRETANAVTIVHAQAAGASSIAKRLAPAASGTIDTSASPPFMTMKALAARWQVDVSTVCQMSKAGKIPHTRIGNSVRFKVTDVLAYEAANEHKGAGSHAPRPQPTGVVPGRGRQSRN